MLEKYKIIGKDTAGISQISYKKLEELSDKTLKLIYVKEGFPPMCTFVFNDETAYMASGFGVGYSGEGPHTFHKAIRLFSDKIAPEFENTVISKLAHDKSWTWTPEEGFKQQ